MEKLIEYINNEITQLENDIQNVVNDVSKRTLIDAIDNRKDRLEELKNKY